MKNYCTYRIACTIQILFFFFIAIIWNDFQIPVFVICLISILNDGTIISIAYDSVMPSQQPEAWDLPQTVGISATIGLAGVCSTMFQLYLAGGAGRLLRAPCDELLPIRVSPDALLPVGTSITARHFVPGQHVDVQGVTRGKGFQGVMKRWGFSGQPASHGHSLLKPSDPSGSSWSAGRGRETSKAATTTVFPRPISSAKMPPGSCTN